MGEKLITSVDDLREFVGESEAVKFWVLWERATGNVLVDMEQKTIETWLSTSNGVMHQCLFKEVEYRELDSSTRNVLVGLVAGEIMS